MSHKDNADLRSTGEGGWCYTEHELFSVFLPLIGADGGMVYMAMTRLVPLAAVRAEFPVTVEAVSRESCVSRSTTHRKIREMVQLGMVLETRHSNRRPSTYKLPPLRELARVGVAELKRRLAEHSGIPQGDTKAAGKRVDVIAASVEDAAQRQAGRVDSIAAEDEAVQEAPAGCGDSGIPPWDTEGCEGAKGEQRGDSGTPVSQKLASVSQNEASVSQGGIPFNSLKKKKEIGRIPPSPPGGAVGAEIADQGKGEGPLLPWEELQVGQPGYAESLPIAARWVLAQCGVSLTRRLETMVTGQLHLTCERPRGLDQRANTLQEAAAEMAARWHAYRGMCERQELRIQWGFVQFIGEGLWARPAAWPKVQPSRSAAGMTRIAAIPTVEATKAMLARENEDRKAQLEYWRQMKQSNEPQYQARAPRWAREWLDSDDVPPVLERPGT